RMQRRRGCIEVVEDVAQLGKHLGLQCRVSRRQATHRFFEQGGACVVRQPKSLEAAARVTERCEREKLRRVRLPSGVRGRGEDVPCVLPASCSGGRLAEQKFYARDLALVAGPPALPEGERTADTGGRLVVREPGGCLLARAQRIRDGTL